MACSCLLVGEKKHWTAEVGRLQAAASPLVEQVKEVRMAAPRLAAAADKEAVLASAALEGAALLGVLMAAAAEKGGCVCGAGGSCLGAAV